MPSRAQRLSFGTQHSAAHALEYICCILHALTDSLRDGMYGVEHAGDLLVSASAKGPSATSMRHIDARDVACVGANLCNV